LYWFGNKHSGRQSGIQALESKGMGGIGQTGWAQQNMTTQPVTKTVLKSGIISVEVRLLHNIQ
jgi:hypothetical protein